MALATVGVAAVCLAVFVNTTPRGFEPAPGDNVAAPGFDTSQAPPEGSTPEGVPPPAEPETPDATAALQLGDLIGVSMPWQGTQNWAGPNSYAAHFGPALEAAGFEVVVDDAGNDSGKQIQQIEAMIAQGAKVIIIGAVDGNQLGNVLDQAKAQNVIVLGYDRTIDGTASVDGVVQYGAFATGVAEGQALIQGLEESGAPKPWTIELFAGATDPNAASFFDGAMSLLQPMIDGGDVVVGSGQASFADVATQDWANEKAQTRMESLLTSTYTDGIGPVGVLVPNDGIARAVLTACEGAGFDLPVVDGLDAEDISIGWVRAGKQYATIAKPTDDLVVRTLEIITHLLTSPELPAPDFTLNNGVKEVGIYTLEPTIITQANIDDYFPCSDATDSEQATNWGCE